MRKHSETNYLVRGDLHSFYSAAGLTVQAGWFVGWAAMGGLVALGAAGLLPDLYSSVGAGGGAVLSPGAAGGALVAVCGAFAALVAWALYRPSPLFGATLAGNLVSSAVVVAAVLAGLAGAAALGVCGWPVAGPLAVAALVGLVLGDALGLRVTRRLMRPVTGGAGDNAVMSAYCARSGGAVPFPVVLRAAEGGYVAACPLVPGCTAQGGTTAEALANLAERLQAQAADAQDLPDAAALLVIDLPAKG